MCVDHRRLAVLKGFCIALVGDIGQVALTPFRSILAGRSPVRLMVFWPLCLGPRVAGFLDPLERSTG
jgi:hypothetical protein